ncbi:MAG: SDR family oxidoreductase [Solobacterium sp.]|nr:SDR family oxidoreductase [Solobacterium sp.]
MTHKVLVTGGAGFIGSHLCRRLFNEGNEVICLDNLFTGSLENIRDLNGREGFTFINHDVTEPFDIEADRIFNLACPASPVHYQFDPVKTAKTSVLGAMNVLELGRKYHARVFQASTSEVYGDPLIHPQTESYRGNVNPIGIRACYDEGKRMAETLFFDYSRQYGVDIRVVRIFNTYGPAMLENDGRVISNFIVQALNDEDITVYGDGSQTRSFCYVSDTVEAFLRMMEQNSFAGPVNIGNPAEMTVLELAEKVIAMTGSSSEIVRRPLPSDDPTRRKPVITQAKEKLGWQPVVPLEQGLAETIAYFREKLQK